MADEVAYQRTEGLSTLARLLLRSEIASERLPNVVKEAMMCGCICISSRIDGIDELINDGVTGFVVDAHDNDTVTERIDDFFTGFVQASGVRTAAETHTRRGFTLKTSVRPYPEHWRHAKARRTTR